MKSCNPEKKKAFTVLLLQDTFQKLAALANKQGRPVSQMARLIIEKAVTKK